MTLKQPYDKNFECFDSKLIQFAMGKTHCSNFKLFKTSIYLKFNFMIKSYKKICNLKNSYKMKCNLYRARSEIVEVFVMGKF